MDKETIMQLLADGVISNEVATKYFPELKESEDEIIRKEILDYIDKSTGCKRWIDWLEKQGEPTEINSEFDSQLNRLLKQFESLPKEELASSLSFYLNVVQNDGTYKDEEEQGEQKPTDKCEGCNNVKGCIACVDGGEWAHIEESKSFWSEEDETYLKHCITAVKNYYTNDKGKENPFREPILDFLISLKDRIQPQPKHEWSEDDEIRHKTTLDDLEGFLEYIKQKPSREISKYSLMSKDSMLTAIQKDIDWFRTLKERIQPQNTWKPSDKQMELLKEACDRHWEPDGLDPLYTLYQDLKKLREE